MPRQSTARTEHLIKRHTRSCTRPAALPACACSWRGYYKRREVVLSKWADCKVDPHSKGEAIIVLNRFTKAVDDKTFDPAGEHPALGDQLTLKVFIEHEWMERHAVKRKLALAGLGPMLQVIVDGRLGRYTLEDLATASQAIERWLDAEAVARAWKDKTWNDYRDLLNRILKRAVGWGRITVNPIATVDRKLGVEQPEHFRERHLLEDVEDRLFEACALLNRPQYRPTKAKLTQALADEIRGRLAAGEPGNVLAAAYQVSPAVVSAIKLGDIWNPVGLTRGTRGDEMRRRLVGVFDGGLRAGEMLDVTIDDVDWRLKTKVTDGVRTQWYEIRLRSTITKGGKRTGETQIINAATQRFRDLLTARRFQLSDKPPGRRHIWGNEDGRRPVSFKRQWRDLFTLAGLDWGRAKGLTWHTGRHEFISRLAEQTTDTQLVKEISRHRRLETTEKYMHSRRDARVAAVAGLERGKR